jgi:hypothetical protein
MTILRHRGQRLEPVRNVTRRVVSDLERAVPVAREDQPHDSLGVGLDLRDTGSSASRGRAPRVRETRSRTSAAAASGSRSSVKDSVIRLTSSRLASWS